MSKNYDKIKRKCKKNKINIIFIILILSILIYFKFIKMNFLISLSTGLIIGLFFNSNIIKKNIEKRNWFHNFIRGFLYGYWLFVIIGSYLSNIFFHKNFFYQTGRYLLHHFNSISDIDTISLGFGIYIFLFIIILLVYTQRYMKEESDYAHINYTVSLHTIILLIIFVFLRGIFFNKEHNFNGAVCFIVFLIIYLSIILNKLINIMNSSDKNTTTTVVNLFLPAIVGAIVGIVFSMK